MRGDPVSITIGVLVLLGIIGWAVYRSRAKSRKSDVAYDAEQFDQPPKNSPYHER